jgi:hypothetical protein
MSKSKYVAETGARSLRSRNIATAILELKELNPQATGVGTARLRAHIRARLGLEALGGEARLGDLRAHGDALGGHGLKLKVVREGANRVIKFTPENLRICRDHLSQEQNEVGTLL